jgi:hypothetical protein
MQPSFHEQFSHRFPAVWTPDGCVVVEVDGVPVFASRKGAPVFSGPLFPEQERSQPQALEAWIDIVKSLTAQPVSVDQSLSSSVLSASSRPKLSRENFTAHVSNFAGKARSCRSVSPLHLSALDCAQGLTEAFFACKGE